MYKYNKKAPLMLVILDGFGYRKEQSGNAVAHANMPFWHFLTSNFPSTLLKASGEDVGLLPGYMGNSEVGHLTLGAGRIIPSMLKKMHNSIEDGSFYHNEVLLENLSLLKKKDKALHLMGLVSDGGVHSHEYHLHTLTKLAHKLGLKKIFIHAFLDGRDTPPLSATTYLERIEKLCCQLSCGTIASIHGRFYAMDRDNNWDRTHVAYQVLCESKVASNKKFSSWRAILESSYQQGITDEFIYPVLLVESGAIKPEDGVIFFNFRPDRAKQLTEAFINPLFRHFNNPINTGNKTLSFFITPTQNKKEFSDLENQILFPRECIEHTLLDEIASQWKPSPPEIFIIAETEKFAHVTYFFRGMDEKELSSETRILIPSIKTKNYVAHPEMSALAITSTLIKSLRSKPASFYLVNYANADMVGHSGNFAATVKACEVIDRQLSQLYYEVVEHQNGAMIITADHGNAEQKIDATGNPLTAHTTNPVPFVLVSKDLQKDRTTTPFQEKPEFGLAHCAPTILKIMGLSVPSVMKQETIFREKL